MPAPASIPATTAPAQVEGKLGPNYIPRNTQYELWAKKRRACPHLSADAAKAEARWLEMQNAHLSNLTDQPAQARRGRPALRMENPIVELMPTLSLDRPGWLDDVLRGSIASSVGAHKGQLNVRTSDVVAALHLRIITVRAIKRPDMGDRTAQSIAKAARHAARGIDHYLHRHPHIKAGLVETIELERALTYPAAELAELPQGI